MACGAYVLNLYINSDRDNWKRLEKMSSFNKILNILTNWFNQLILTMFTVQNHEDCKQEHGGGLLIINRRILLEIKYVPSRIDN